MTIPAGATFQGGPWGMGDGAGSPSVPSPTAPPGGLIARVLQTFPPDIYPIPDATEFNPEGDVASAAVGTVTIPCTVTLPPGSIGVIRGVSFYIDNMLTTTNVLYTVLVNGAAVPGYGQIKIFPRAAPSVSNGFDAFIRLSDGVTVTVTAQNIDGGSYIVGAALSGWFWSRQSGARWMGTGA